MKSINFKDNVIDVNKIIIAEYLSKRANMGPLAMETSSQNDFRIPFQKYIQSNPIVHKYFSKPNLKSAFNITQDVIDSYYSPENLDMLVPECLDGINHPNTDTLKDSILEYSIHHLIGAQHFYLITDIKLCKLINSYYKYIKSTYYIDVPTHYSILPDSRIIYLNTILNQDSHKRNQALHQMFNLYQSHKLKI